MFRHDAPVTSRIINYSDNGLMIELDCYLPPGDAIAVHFEAEAAEAEMYGSSTCIGMVRWCAKQECQFGALYGVGVELANRFSKRTVHQGA